jgi:hypothetical protein
MPDPIDQFGYNKQLYQRPNQKWVCGHSAEGCPCRLGPDSKGRCVTSHECGPVLITKGGDKGRWICTRPAAFGGKCKQGPYPDGTCCKQVPPCEPQLSIRGKRGVVNRWTICLTVGLVGIALGIPWKMHLLSPGPLTKQHQGASIASKERGINKSGNDCAQCHAAAEMGVAGFMSTALSGGIDAIEDSLRCLNCHDKGADAFNPHGVEAAQLVAWSSTHGGNPEPPDAIACSACHKEHHGANFDLSKLSNDQCQSCHTDSFHSFGKGHPEFADGAYPFDRRTRLIFDHQSHIDTHFKKDYKDGETTPGMCADCHIMDSSSGFMQTKSFKQTCATCHNHTDQIEGTTETEAIAFIQLPGVDTGSAKEKGVDLTYWPASRRAGSDGLTPFMQLLLAGGDAPTLDADLALVADLPRGYKDLRTASAQQLQAIDRILKATRVLIDELANQEGTEVLQQRIESAIGRPLSHEELADLTAHFPQVAIKAARDEWFKE